MLLQTYTTQTVSVYFTFNWLNAFSYSIVISSLLFLAQMLILVIYLYIVLLWSKRPVLPVLQRLCPCVSALMWKCFKMSPVGEGGRVPECAMCESQS
jgi:hypothetical protein